VKKLKDVEDIKKNLKKMGWDDLAGNLIDLELEYEETKLSLNKDSKDAFNLLILLYEEEKTSRLEKSFDQSRHFEDFPMVAYDWTDDIVDL
jgi:hypothetical protein